MIRRWPVPLGLALFSLSVGCLTVGCITGNAPPSLARVRVEVRQGIAAESMKELESPSPVHVIAEFSADLSREMAYASRSAAARFLAALPEGTSVDLRVPGSPEIDCGAPVVVEAPQEPGRARALAESLLDSEPTRPGSLAWALDSLLEDLPAEPARRRIVVFSDFGQRCSELARDPCAAANELAQRGAQIDLVAMGGGEVPACFTQLAVSTGSPPFGIDVYPPSVRLPFRVESREPRGADGGGDPSRPLMAEGWTGSEVRVVPGLVRVVVELEPEMVIFPVWLEPGELKRIRVLDVPLLDLRRSFVDQPKR